MLDNETIATLNRQWQVQGFLLLKNMLDLHAFDLNCLQPQRMMQGIRGGSRDVLEHELVQVILDKLQQLPEFQALCDEEMASIQCTLFEKHAQRNWLVSWHQDLSIPVTTSNLQRDWGVLSCKQGRWFAQAPAAYLARCLAVRVHLDRCGPEDGALRVLPGTHKYGRLNAVQIVAMQHKVDAVSCFADVGDILLMRPALLHASSKGFGNGRRRVLHFLFVPVGSSS